MSGSYESPFHAGEQAVQMRAGVAERADSLGRRMIQSTMSPIVQAFLSRSSLLLLGTSDQHRTPWGSLAFGSPGFMQASHSSTLLIQITPGLEELVRVGEPIAGLAMDFESRQRVRVNGQVARVDSGTVEVIVEEVYGNCDRYIHARRAPVDSVSQPSAAVRCATLSREAALLIAEADTFFIASQVGEGEVISSLDVSHRGGPPGFVIVAHERCLLFPDYPGNGMFNTLGNLHVDPRVGLLFVDFSTGSTLQVSGRATVLWEAHHISRFPGAERVVAVDIEQVRATQGAAPAGWYLGEPSPVFGEFPTPPMARPPAGGLRGTIQAINLALPQEVDNKGTPVATGIFKQTTSGPVRLRALNLEGDGQADLLGHGGAFRAVYVYPQAHYAYWAGELSRDDFAPGQFGENLTVQGIDEQSVFVGDVFEVGDALVEVSQPRIPCYKLALKMGIDGFESEFLRSGRIGFYLRVLRGGTLKAGDRLKLVARDPAGMSVRAISDLLFFETDDLDATRQALSIRALAHGWKGSFEQRLLAAQREAAASALRPLVVKRKVAESAAITSFYLEPADGEPLASFLPGQFLTLELPLPDHDEALVRTYSLSDAPGRPWYRISVKREAPSGAPPGEGSGYLHDQVAEGDTIRVGAPRGKFVLADLGAERPLVLLSAGVGITPLLSMLNAVVESGATRAVWFVHGARNGREQAFGEHLRAVALAHENVTLHVAYSAPRQEDVQGTHYDSVGRVDVPLLKRLLPFDDYEFYMVGPTGFMRSLYTDLTAMGIPSSRVHYEFFGAAESFSAASQVSPGGTEAVPGVSVSFRKSEVTGNWQGQGSLLDLAEAQGLHPPYSCRSGICQTCRCRLLAGEVAYQEQPLTPLPAGEVLVCIAEPVGDGVVLDL